VTPGLKATLEEWLVSDDPVERAHAAWRLAQPGETPLAGSVPPPTPAPIPLAESLPLLRLVNLCPYRSTAGCGCSGARCGLRSAATVSHRDCFDCVARYGNT
jgi:hypothetical protein